MSYQDTIAQLRQEAAVRELRERVEAAEQVAQEIRENERMAAELEREGDRAGALEYAHLANDAERELSAALAKLPQQQPQLSEAKLRFIDKHRDFLERHGAKALEAFGHAHAYVTRAKNPNTNDPSRTGMNLVDDSPEYFSALENILELYGSGAGLRFEPEGSLTANEAARISNISGAEWNQQAQRMVDAGHNSDAIHGRRFDRKV